MQAYDEISVRHHTFSLIGAMLTSLKVVVTRLKNFIEVKEYTLVLDLRMTLITKFSKFSKFLSRYHILNG